jgi:hypothetical protein
MSSVHPLVLAEVHLEACMIWLCSSLLAAGHCSGFGWLAMQHGWRPLVALNGRLCEVVLLVCLGGMASAPAVAVAAHELRSGMVKYRRIRFCIADIVVVWTCLCCTERYILLVFLTMSSFFSTGWLLNL